MNFFVALSLSIIIFKDLIIRFAIFLSTESDTFYLFSFFNSLFTFYYIQPLPLVYRTERTTKGNNFESLDCPLVFKFSVHWIAAGWPRKQQKRRKTITTRSSWKVTKTTGGLGDLVDRESFVIDLLVASLAVAAASSRGGPILERLLTASLSLSFSVLPHRWTRIVSCLAVNRCIGVAIVIVVASPGFYYRWCNSTIVCYPGHVADSRVIPFCNDCRPFFIDTIAVRLSMNDFS